MNKFIKGGQCDIIGPDMNLTFSKKGEIYDRPHVIVWKGIDNQKLKLLKTFSNFLCKSNTEVVKFYNIDLVVDFCLC